MAERTRFRIIDLVVAVAVAAGPCGAYALLERRPDGSDFWEIAFWLIVWGYAAIAYVVVRFVRTLAMQLLALGISLAFAAAAIGIYGQSYLPDFRPLALLSLAPVALVLVSGGIAHGLLDHWHALKSPLHTTSIETPSTSTPHPLDRDTTP
jgi:hypothetical protein